MANQDFLDLVQNLKEFTNNFIDKSEEVVCNDVEQHVDSTSDSIVNLNLLENNDNNLTLWHKTPIKERSFDLNIIKPIPSLTDCSKNIQTPLQIWELYFSFIDEIVLYTNDNIRLFSKITFIKKNCYCENNINQNRSHRKTCTNSKFMKLCFVCKQIEICTKHLNICDNCFNSIIQNHCYLTTDIEIRAFCGILYTLGAVDSVKSENWNPLDLLKIAFDGMNVNRFIFLMNVICFDDLTFHEQRELTDNLASLRSIYETFNANLTKAFSPGIDCTIDEIYLKFNGACKFKKRIPNNCEDFGIKFFSLVDCKTKYISNIEIDCGKQPSGPFETDFECEPVFKRIANPFLDFGRNITLSDSFTSFQLSNDMFNRYTTIVGAIKPNQNEIPSFISDTSSRSKKSSLFGFNERGTILSYITELNEHLLLLSTKHHNDDILDNQIPDMVDFYMRTKDATKIAFEDCQKYSATRNCRKYPLYIFSLFLNIAAHNGSIIHSLANGLLDPEMFLRELIQCLVQPYLYVLSFHNLKIPKDYFCSFNTFSINKLNELVYEECLKLKKVTSTCLFCSAQTCVNHVFYNCNICVQKRKLITEID